MTGARKRPEADYLRLKASVRRLQRDVGGLEAAAIVAGRSTATHGRYQHPDDPSFMPLDVVLDLQSETGTVPVLDTLADLHGFLLVRKPPADADPEWVARLGQLGKEAGEAISKLSQALTQGGTITAEESRDLDLRRECREAMMALAEIDAALADLEKGAAA